MQVWIFRHADAEESSESGKDEDRALTRDGVRRAAAVGRGLAELQPGIEAILTSPYRRARETARVAAQALGLAKVVDSRSLEPGRDPAAVAEALREVDTASPTPRVAVVRRSRGGTVAVGSAAILRLEDGTHRTVSSDGMPIVLRPLHREKTPPEGLECVVRILEAVPRIDTECTPPQGPGQA